ncbi:MAG: RidA family protein [Chloroflexi bacterium]|nr:RidA family protein [Chloroflexota bacterium]
MAKQVIKVESVHKPLGDYSHAWAATGSRLIFVAGQVSVDMSGNVVGPGDIVRQTRAALDNLKKVLTAAGSGMQDVIKMNTYVTNIAEFRAKTRDLRREYFPPDFPAATLVEVKALAMPELMVEIEAVAAVG